MTLRDVLGRQVEKGDKGLLAKYGLLEPITITKTFRDQQVFHVYFEYEDGDRGHYRQYLPLKKWTAFVLRP